MLKPVVGKLRSGDASGMRWTQHPDLLLRTRRVSKATNQQARTTSRSKHRFVLIVANEKRS
jgi:hypothetical protein